MMSGYLCGLAGPLHHTPVLAGGARECTENTEKTFRNLCALAQSVFSVVSKNVAHSLSHSQ